MSAIKISKAIIILMCLMFIQTGCFQNIQSKASKEEEPVVVILDDDTSSKEGIKVSEHTEDNKTSLTYNQYNVDLKVNPKEKTFEGIQKVTYKNQTNNPLESIYFNLYLNAFKENSKTKSYFSDFKDEGYLEIESVLVNNEEVIFNESETLLEISLKEQAAPDESIEITIQFNGKVPSISNRAGANGKMLWMGDFLPTLAVYDDNGWSKDTYYPIGDPFYTNISNYHVKVRTPKDYLVIGSGEETETEKENEKVTTIEAKMVRDFAIGVSNQFKKESIETEEGFDINLYYTNNALDTHRTLKAAEAALRYFGEKVGSYPYSELDIVEGELFSFPSTGYSNFVLIDSKKLQESSVEANIAHEVGHQWFYNIVGSNQIKEPWLDEAIILYLQGKMFFSEDTLKKEMNRQRKELIKAMEPMREKSLHNDLGAYSNWDSYYDIQYIRGELMIYALEKKLGQDKFNEFLKAYYQKYSFKIADSEGFIKTAEEAYGHSLQSFFDQWMDSEKLP